MSVEERKRYYITEKTVALLVLVVLVLAGFTYALTVTLATVSDANDKASHAARESRETLEKNSSLSDVSEIVYEAIMRRERKLYVQHDTAKCGFGRWLSKENIVDLKGGTEDERSILSTLTIHHDTLHVMLLELEKLLKKGEFKRAEKYFLDKYSPQDAKIKNELSGIIAVHELKGQKLIQESKKWAKKVLIRWSVAGMLVVALVIAISGSILYSNRKASREKDDMQKQVLQSSKLASIGELASGVAHEINNPLAIIRGHIEILESMYDNITDEQREMMVIIDDSVERIKTIVNGLRTYARSDSDSVGVIDVHGIIMESFALIGNIIEQKNIKIVTNLYSRNPKVVGNGGKFQQVVMNLLNNAKDAMSKNGGDLTVSTEDYKGSVILKIVDNGCGIAGEHLDRIFDTFFTTKAPGEGTGLGLGIVQSIIHGMYGTIDVESSVGVGTTFKIKLPSTDMAADGKEEKARVTEGDTLQGKVLVVDDEEPIRTMLTSLLKTLGLTVDAVDSGESALLKLANERYDIVLTDIQMPEMAGDELITRVREDMGLTDVKFVVITGGLDVKNVGQREKYLMDIADGFLPKPFTRKEIFEVLSTLKVNK